MQIASGAFRPRLNLAAPLRWIGNVSSTQAVSSQLRLSSANHLIHFTLKTAVDRACPRRPRWFNPPQGKVSIPLWALLDASKKEFNGYG